MLDNSQTVSFKQYILNQWEASSPADLAKVGAQLSLSLATLYILASVVYNLYFHPLAKFPGPFLARSSLLWRIFHTMGGRFHRVIDRQHEIYGDVFRVSPNELSFASVDSWKAIYGFPTPGQPTLIKSKFYDMYGAGFKSLCIGSERDPKAHSRMKKSLSAAFSTKSLLEQEDIIQRCVDGFVERIGKDGAPGTKGLNMTKWYEMVAFDILGEMAFGESFHCIENGKSHFWAELIVDHLYFITIADNLRQYPPFVYLARLASPYLGSIRNKHTGYTREKVESRLSSKSSRKDFFTTLAKKVESGEVDKEEMTAHTSTLIIAGGETVSTFLAATTYHLLRNPDAYQKLRDEIRGRYKSYEEIDANSALQLPYVQAIISEGLRIYPPGSQGFPRISPGTTVSGHWVPEGAEIYTSAWTVTHDPRNFHDPHSFKPERWTDKECTDIKEASQPFSLGPRGCLGRNFAYVEMALILAKMHWRYDMEMVNQNQKWEEDSSIHVMWSKPELFVRFHERE